MRKPRHRAVTILAGSEDLLSSLKEQSHDGENDNVPQTCLWLGIVLDFDFYGLEACKRFNLAHILLPSIDGTVGLRQISVRSSCAMVVLFSLGSGIVGKSPVGMHSGLTLWPQGMCFLSSSWDPVSVSLLLPLPYPSLA